MRLVQQKLMGDKASVCGGSHVQRRLRGWNGGLGIGEACHDRDNIVGLDGPAHRERVRARACVREADSGAVAMRAVTR